MHFEHNRRDRRARRKVEFSSPVDLEPHGRGYGQLLSKTEKGNDGGILRLGIRFQRVLMPTPTF